MKLVAVMSVPRLGFTDFYATAVADLLNRGIALKTVSGVFWGQCLQNGIQQIFTEEEVDGIITIDYDTIFTSKSIAQLVAMAEAYPEADAICPVQMGRFDFGMLARREPKITTAELRREMVNIDGGHFGLTFLRASALKETPLPWFIASANEEGKFEQGKTDEDIHFWNVFRDAGKKTYLAPRIVVGHIEQMVKWPDKGLDPIYQEIGNYRQSGAPSETWQ